MSLQPCRNGILQDAYEKNQVLHYPSSAPRFAAAMVPLLGMMCITACQTPGQRVAQHEDYLAAAGFVVRPANTPDRQAMLKRLPAHKFVQRGSGETVHYVYADPSVCNCLYVGSEKAYSKYQEDKQTRRQEKRLEHELALNQHAAEDDGFSASLFGPVLELERVGRMGSGIRIWPRTRVVGKRGLR